MKVSFMEIIFIFGFIFLVYGLPEILKKRRQPKEYEYPNIPDQTGNAANIKLQPVDFKANVSQSIGSFMAPPVVPAEQTLISRSTIRKIEINQATLVNGFVFSEIIAPPRALRPFVLRGGAPAPLERR